jgi:hypothetical protein
VRRPAEKPLIFLFVLERQVHPRTESGDFAIDDHQIEFAPSATRRSRGVFVAVSTACFAASSQELSLVPMSSVTR